MPEGHLIHHYARQQRDGLPGRTVVTSPQGRFPEATNLDGCELTRIEPYGKHLLYWWGERIAHVHLGMRGLFLHHDPPAPEPRPQVRLRIAGPALVVDLIAPLRCELLAPSERANLVAGLGPDPLRDGADVEAVWSGLQRRRTSIGAALLDQTLVAGIGNVIRAEALHLAGIDPRRSTAAITRRDFDRLWQAVCDIMQRASATGRIVTAERGGGGERRVYKQQTCGSCGAAVEAFDLAGRTAYACPVDQPR